MTIRITIRSAGNDHHRPVVALLCVLCVSVVQIRTMTVIAGGIHHRDAENTEKTNRLSSVAPAGLSVPSVFHPWLSGSFTYRRASLRVPSRNPPVRANPPETTATSGRPT